MKLEHLPDEYLNDLRSRGYQEKLRILKQHFTEGRINRIQFLAFKNELDRKFPNPKVDWRRLPKKFHTVHELGDDYEEDPAVNIVVPEFSKTDDNNIKVTMKDLELIDKDGKPRSQKIAELRNRSQKIVDDFTEKKRRELRAVKA